MAGSIPHTSTMEPGAAHATARRLAALVDHRPDGPAPLPPLEAFDASLRKVLPAFELMRREALEPRLVFVPAIGAAALDDMLGRAYENGPLAGRFGVPTMREITWSCDEERFVTVPSLWDVAVISARGAGKGPTHVMTALRSMVGHDGPARLDPPLSVYLCLQAGLVLAGDKPVDSRRPPVWTRLADTGLESRDVIWPIRSLVNQWGGHLPLQASWDTGWYIDTDVVADPSSGRRNERSTGHRGERIIVRYQANPLAGGKIRPTVLASWIR
ncbi:hypothetical protein [Myceligenerans salitolerans]|uniref:Uncharacterized protein n=1 Tax=Myceligenerans salitolerans TaxID=1230528 RepID=A0ABS3IBR8_9MICO|nr:hypothetical protein [Myceligenerans salitolerans]MBO0610066.1 hypothetical protein [Myceligenerans salitolerans]